MSRENAKVDVLITQEAIAMRVKELAADISQTYAGESVVFVPILKGSFIFAADLCRAVDLPTEIDFLGVQSYGSETETTGVVKIVNDLTHVIENRHVVIVEDIVDTGLTMSYLLEMLGTRKPASLRVAALLHKPARARVKVPIDFLGFTIEDVFVVGYGLDYAERFRNLPFIGAVT